MRKAIITIGLFVFCIAAKAQIEGTSIPSLPQLTAAEMATISNPNIGSSIFVTDDQKVYTYTSTGWVTTLGDNLGDHTATENIQTDGNWISNDGGNEGIQVSTTGNIGINTPPRTDSRIAAIGANDVAGLYLTGEDNIWFDAGQVRITTHDGFGNWQIKSGADNDDVKIGSGAGAVKNRIDEAGIWSVYSQNGLTNGDVISWNLGLYQNADGNVGIGAGPATGNKLDVAGKTQTDTFQMTSGATNGYLMQSDGAGNATWTDPSALFTNTDNQTLTLSGTTLGITGGNSVNLNAIGSDNQNIANLAFSGTTLTVGIEDGSSQTVSLAPLADNQSIQNLTFSGTTLTVGIEDGSSDTVSLAALANTDSQDLSIGSGGVANQSVEVAISGGNNAVVDIRDADSVIGNESVTGLSFDGTTLTLTQDGAANETVNLSSVNADNIYTTNGALTANRAVTQNNFDLNFDANTLVIDGSADRVGIGTLAPARSLDVVGSIQLSDRIYFDAKEGIRDGGAWLRLNQAQAFTSGTLVNGRFRVDNAVIFNETGGNFDTRIEGDTDVNLFRTDASSDRVGIGVGSPSAKLDVNGNARIRTLPAAADTDQLVSADVNGNLTKVNSLKASKVFYPPSIAIDASVTGTFTVDLHAQYIAQFGSPVVSSAGTIPTYAANELDYHVTYADPSVFGNGTTVQNMSVNASGILSYEIFNAPADYNSLINVVFVVK